MAVDYEEGRRLLVEARLQETDERWEEFEDWLRDHAAALLNPDPWRPIEEADEDPDTVIEVYAPAAHGLNAIVCLCQWHPDAGFCVDEFREVTHYRPHHPPTSAN